MYLPNNLYVENVIGSRIVIELKLVVLNLKNGGIKSPLSYNY